MKDTIQESPITLSNALQGYTFAGSKYTNEQRIEAVANYMILGTLSKTSEACGIPLATLYRKLPRQVDHSKVETLALARTSAGVNPPGPGALSKT